MAKRNRRLPSMVIYVEVEPVRWDVSAQDIAYDVGHQLRGLEDAVRIVRGHVSDRRWDILDPAARFGVPEYWCKGLLTTDEVAEKLAVSVATVRKWCNNGTIDATREVDRSWRIPYRAYEAMSDVLADERAD